MKKKNKFIKMKWYWIVAIAIIAVEAISFLMLGEHIYMSAQDNMELHVLDYHLLKIYHFFFSHDVTVPILHGVSRDLFFSEWNIYSFLYMIFPAVYAYEIALILKTIFGVTFCTLFAKDLLKEEYERYECPVVLCGLAFGLLPLYPMFSIYFISLPLALFLLRKIWYTGERKWYACLFLYPFLSYFAFFGFFILAYLFFFTLVQFLKKKKESYRMLAAMIILAIGYVAFEYRLFYEMLFENTDSIRNSFEISFLSGQKVIGTIVEVFSNSIFHAESLQKWFVMPVCLIACGITGFKAIKNKKISLFINDPLNKVLGLILLNSMIYGIYFWKPCNQLFERILPVLTGFQFNRTLYFNPFLWYVAFCIVMIRMWKKPQFLKVCSGKIISGMMCFIAIMIILVSDTRYNDIYHNIYNYAYRFVKGQESNNLTFQEFFSEELFEDIKTKINYQGEYAIAYGMEPGILSYNQIATLDGVLSYYPQGYKEDFRTVIAPALERCQYYQNYYDDWGARAYIFPGKYEQIYSPVRNMEITDENLYIDVDAFQKLDGVYIFSRIKVDNADTLKLDLVGIFSMDSSPYIIYVYRPRNMS